MVLYPSANELRQREQQQQQQRLSLLDPAAQSVRPRMTEQVVQSAPYLSTNQQDLLLAALNAQARDLQTINSPAGDSGLIKPSTSDQKTSLHANMSDPSLFMSPQDAELDNFNGDYTPDLDYLDGDNSFDFDNADLGGEMIGSLPRSNSEQTDEDGNDHADGHEKRKSIGDKDEDDEADPKRHEGEKGAKKPGRKPLTSEPTTKRKAQNRAAQRAFRERKEKHLKDLETKVNEMNKTHQADKQENGVLKAEVDRLKVELREHRKRLSLNGGSSNARGSPPPSVPPGRSNSGPTRGGDSNFQFDFPRFGALPGSQIFGNQQSSANGVLQRTSNTPPLVNAGARHAPTSGIIGELGGMGSQLPAQVLRTNSQGSQNGRTLSPKTTTPTGSVPKMPISSQLNNSFPSVGYSSANNMHGFASTLPQMGDFSDLFSPSLLKNAVFDVDNNGYFGGVQQQSGSTMAKDGTDASTGGESTAGLNRVFQFNGSSNGSDSASPSNSSSSQWNANAANSSCGTSPEPSHGSPADRSQNSTNSYIGETASLPSQYSTSSQLYSQQQAVNGWGNSGLTGNDNIDFSMPSAATFDPVLFGDYREAKDTSYNSNDFGSGAGFFDEALDSAPFDYGSPSNLFGILQQSPQQTHSSLNASSDLAPSKSLMAEIEKTRDGGDDDYGLPVAGEVNSNTNQNKAKLISCNNIWNQLQSNPDFQNGTFDLDNLCSELRAKARCSESGVMVSQDHVDAALKKLAKRDETTGKYTLDSSVTMPTLLFEQAAWDNVQAKFGAGGGGMA
ncbi:DNA-binding transcription factor yap1 [Friedmanniomyces endolithicus]|uniref:DNA-binding transcription factor yap1 n=1 Tax=Friedmanniomyces endolithicus TaxID=329885 RepID=A0AAN6JBJ8_9PEZI|nr:DNA-binding transcription factor yap1 [Friedmanniomyces endolithicus]KAK0931393.1 DNA-binding transcription factor yap1 [Friedmanniomyces endolithicus]KAK1010814.1 DNA-binding transcription factor yap1 [Friedmanniomyces endolithicus]KAK1016322.1 DNA-binding transcription factor yap1 [Friedmanniomyces endolithicus]KAK1054717.1 DNA-binding transcription factor yap1 [Friedmanniomyces endolithicus]